MLKERNRELLTWVRDRLADGTITELSHDSYLCDTVEGNKFYMGKLFESTWVEVGGDKFSGSYCGTIGCIGGWMAIRALKIEPDENGVYDARFMDMDVFRKIDALQASDPVLGDLFYPYLEVRLGSLGSYSRLYSRITLATAIKAINHLLETGEVASWQELIAEGEL